MGLKLTRQKLAGKWTEGVNSIPKALFWQEAMVSLGWHHCLMLILVLLPEEI